MKTTTKLLIAEKELLSDPIRWIKGKIASNSDGIDVSAIDPSAICWCQAGAQRRAIDENFCVGIMEYDFHNYKTKRTIAANFGYCSAIEFNDSQRTTHEDLMQFYDDCIAASI